MRQPERGPRAATGDPRRAGIDAQSPRRSSSESRSPNATPSSTARTRAPRSWRSSSPVKAAAGDGIGVRCPLAREVGREQQPVDARAPRLRLVDEVGERRLRREPVAQPLQRAGGRQHHAHRVPLARHGVAERVHARLRIGRRTRAAPRRRRRRCPSRSRAGPGRSIPTPSAAAAQSPAPAATGIPVHFVTGDRDAGDLGRLEDAAAATRAAPRARRAPRPTSARRATSSRSVPDASATSIAHSPVSRSRT